MPIPPFTSPIPDDERQLIARLRGGDEEDAGRAFSEIIARYQAVVEQTAWRVVHDRDVVSDIAQMVWFTCWEARQTRTVRAGLRKYLVCTTRTRALNWHRGERRNDGLVRKVAAWQVADGEDMVENDAIHQLAADDRASTVRAVVMTMPPRQREVYELVTYEEYTHEEIGRLLNMSLSTVRNHMWQANQTMSRALTQDNSAAEAC